MKNILICIFVILNLTISINAEKIGISRLFYSDKNKDMEFYLDLDDKLQSTIIDSQSKEYLALEINSKYDNIKSIIAELKENKETDNPDELKIINELKSVDFCIFYELINYETKQEKDFYYPDKIWNIINIDLKIYIIDVKNKTFIDTTIISNEYRTMKEIQYAKEESSKALIKKVKSYLEEVTIFKLKIIPEEIKPLYTWLDKGSLDGLKPQNILLCYTETEEEIKEKACLKIIKTEENRSLAMIMFANSPINKDDVFTKISKINLELQFAGGFAFTSKYNLVVARNDYISYIPFASIRLMLPVGIAFFRPGFHFEFNFFYLDNKLLIPFTIETGCQGEIFIHRFETDIGIMFGALFSPNKNINYEIDSIILRPYLHLSVLTITSLKLFGEFGYRFYVKNKLYNNWEIDLNGAYLSFGLGVCL